MVTAAASQRPRPDFSDPPVIEVALSVGFPALERYTSAHAGLFWQRAKGTFSTTEEHPPFDIPAVTEATESARPKMRVVDGAPPLRTWLVTPDGGELLQLQRDVFAHNWRKTAPAQPYPRYEAVRARFENHFRAFQAFAQEENLGTVEPQRCDVTYVNHVPVGDLLRTAGDLQELVVPWSWPHAAFLPKPDRVLFSSEFVIRDESGKFGGRLTVDAKPAYRRSDRSGIIVLSLTARGIPLGAGIDGALAFFDLGREWIVRGFADLTTPKMHALWGRSR
ncbi:MAG: TIGR04255 family protein [Acidobacteria bacterium]|nr:TIGR04255 family protein [Acidobacteriota bacterium]